MGLASEVLKFFMWGGGISKVRWFSVRTQTTAREIFIFTKKGL
jgi:hypothetical protein